MSFLAPLSGAALLAFLVVPAQAAGLLVSPHRVVIEGRDRAATVSLMNRETKPVTYRVSFTETIMGADGALEDLPAGQKLPNSAADIVRYSPRQVQVGPGQSQVVRLLVRKPEGLPDGEYRSHLFLQAIPINEKEGIEQIANPKAMSMQLVATPAMAIPVIVRFGDVAATATLSDPKLERSDDARFPQTLKLTVSRAGNGTFYGDLYAGFLSDTGEMDPVGMVSALAVYYPLEARSVSVNLPDLSKYAGKTLTVQLSAREENAGAKGGVLSTVTLPLPAVATPAVAH
jgi:P pilus assembly chaperone PapD